MVKQPEMRVNSATSDTGVLANFFNSLLSKKTADGKIAAGVIIIHMLTMMLIMMILWFIMVGG